MGEFPNTITQEVGADPFIDQLYQNDGIGYGLQLNIPIRKALIFLKSLQNISRTCVISAIWYHTDT